MKCQFSLTVAEGKRLIAKAIAAMPEVRRALRDGVVLLKGGTTVSAVAEELCGEKLRLSGRITPRGTVGAGNPAAEGSHLLAVRNGVPEPAGDRLMEVALGMGPDDVAICGANIYDAQGRAALMAGKDLCGETGSVYPSLEAEGVRCLVAAGLEKLSPEPLPEASRAAGRKTPVWSQGMAVGLVPVPGEIINELRALSLLGYSRRWLIGRGGIAGAEGGSTFVVEGDEPELRRLVALLESIRGARESATETSLPECLSCGPSRQYHQACALAGREKVALGSDKGAWRTRHS